MHHIREALPDLKLKIAQQLAKYRAELGELGDQLADSDSYLVSTQCADADDHIDAAATLTRTRYPDCTWGAAHSPICCCQSSPTFAPTSVR